VDAIGWVTLLALAAPNIDGDGDGVPDRDDKCPADAETYNGYQDGDGCPDLAPRSVSSNDVIQIAERIAFAHDSAELKPVSFPVLDAIAIVIKNQPQQFPVVALEGHAADNERAPMKLSLARASAVRMALQARGVDPNRLLARASGTTAPVCGQQSESCRARERTVEFATLAPTRTTGAAESDKPAAEVEAGAGKAAPAEASPAAIPLERVEFKKGSAVIGPAALANLDILAGFMKATPAALEILGYADKTERGAEGLARARAEAVRAYMVACGVSDKHMTVRAEPAGPRCPARDEACRMRNRRAELRFADGQPAARNAGDAAQAAPPKF
jgi:outer membrane protein OmpA-like peptidoglycan-associated protein